MVLTIGKYLEHRRRRHGCSKVRILSVIGWDCVCNMLAAEASERFLATLVRERHVDLEYSVSSGQVKQRVETRILTSITNHARCPLLIKHQ